MASSRLDERHSGAIGRFSKAKDETTLQTLWTEAMRSGDIPGPYWAVITHPSATVDLRQLAFGNVHMLSHLVGAANRADIRRLVTLEQENDALKARLDAQQERLHAAAVDRQAGIDRMQSEIIELSARVAKTGKHEQGDAIVALQEALSERERQVALQTLRRERAEQDAAIAQSEAARLTAELERARRFVETMQTELHAMEGQLIGEEAEPEADPVLPRLAGRRILYVGGRPRSNAALRTLADRHGIVLAMHDGGIEDRKGLLAAAIPGSEIVVFPADCIDHDSMNQLKRLCERHAVPYRVLRSASVASFIAAMTALASDASDGRTSAIPHFCLRHG